jgi:hypothetical protein
VIESDLTRIGVLRVEGGTGNLLAVGARSMEGLVGWMEMILSDPGGRFLLAFRLKNTPGRPLVQVGIPFLVVDDQGQVIGELRNRFQGLSGRSYALWREDKEYLVVPSATSSKPYPFLLGGAPVAQVSEEKPFLGKPIETRWTVQISGACQHLHVLALAVHVAVSRGATGIPSA